MVNKLARVWNRMKFWLFAVMGQKDKLLWIDDGKARGGLTLEVFLQVRDDATEHVQNFIASIDDELE